MTHTKLDQLADHVERIALQIADGKPSKVPALDAKFLVLAADALRSLGESVTQIAELGHELEGLSVGKSAVQDKP